MAVRNGQQFLAGLRDGREVWYDGKRVDDVTTFPEFQAAIRSIAELYDLQHDPRHREVLVTDIPTSARPAARSRCRARSITCVSSARPT
jgi:4-hydroxyphenylacetate 3-monooxygenase